MKVFLVHGMGRTPVSMWLLGLRLRRAGLQPHYFGYFATTESLQSCVRRLVAKIHSAHGPYCIAGHSLGTTIIRAALPQLEQRMPVSCFFIAPPSRGSRLARRLSPRWIYKSLTGQMGQLLADPAFVAAQAVPSVPTTVYAGTRGFKGRLSPFGSEPNDGILSISETEISSDIRIVQLPHVHTFIMNSNIIAEDIIRTAKTFKS